MTKKEYLYKEELAKTTNNINKLEELSNNEDSWIRFNVAIHSNNTNILEKLANDINPKVRLGVLLNKNTQPHILEKLSENKFNYLKLAEHHNTPVSVLEKISSSTDFEALLSLIKNHNTPSYILEKFSKNENWTLNTKILSHPNCPLNLLEENSNIDRIENFAGENLLKIANVIQNPNCPIHILDKLYNLNDKEIRTLIAIHSSNKGILEKLNFDDSLMVQQKVFLNKNTPKHILKKNIFK